MIVTANMLDSNNHSCVPGNFDGVWVCWERLHPRESDQGRGDQIKEINGDLREVKLDINRLSAR